MSANAPIRLSVAAVEARVGVHRQTISKWYRAGRFPRPHYVAGLRRWYLSDIEGWELAHVRHGSSPKDPRRRTS